MIWGMVGDVGYGGMVDGDVDIAARLFSPQGGAAETAARANRNQTFGNPGQAVLIALAPVALRSLTG